MRKTPATKYDVWGIDLGQQNKQPNLPVQIDKILREYESIFKQIFDFSAIKFSKA